MPRISASLVVVLLGLGLGCSSDPAGGGSSDPTDCPPECDDTCVEGLCVDVDVDAGDADIDGFEDAAGDANDDTSEVVEADATVDAGFADVSALCRPCVGDGECDGGRCLRIGGDRVCLPNCDRVDCPGDLVCTPVDDDPSGASWCVPPDGTCDVCIDRDGDGFFDRDGCGSAVDCDDTRGEAYPGAEELCNRLDDNCNGDVDETYELDVDPLHCGRCDNACTAPNGTPACRLRQCVVDACDPGYANCDGVAANGCEASGDAVNACGGCAELGGAPGEACGTCDSGTWTCDGTERVVCDGDEGPERANPCGGCDELDAMPGTPCGACDRGLWACAGPESLECADDPGPGYTACEGRCCAPGTACSYGACVPAEGCASNADCSDDTYCDADSALCAPWTTGPIGDFDDACVRIAVPGRFNPQLQCTWTPGPDDPHPAWAHVLSTPMVADFDLEGDADLIRPSIVFTSDDGVDGRSELPTGIIRVIDGETCALQATLDMQFTSHSSPPALGDLDGDGVPEIIANKADGGLVAFAYDAESGTWGVRWRSTFPDGSPWEQMGGGWGGPGVHDLDDDGVPEVLRGATVFDNDGVLIDASLGYMTIGSTTANGSSAADYDNDGRVELATGDGMWEWSEGRWVPEVYFVASEVAQRGYTAVGAFDVPAVGDEPDDAAQIVVVRSGEARVQSVTGRILFGPVELPGGGTGGPPTVSDFDGDGRAEFAVASRGAYTVFDLDCRASDEPGDCASGRIDGVLWTRTSQDFSSSQTGSSVFDFEGDGAAEAIYADECFVRVYDGTTGDVVYSQYTSSCTWQENPVVADVDGDLNSELIVPSNTNCGEPLVGRVCEDLEPGGIDPQFVGVQCEENTDCVSSSCVAGYCRCVDDTGCCPDGCDDSGFVCAAPPDGTPGTGNTCRAAHTRGAFGIRVYRDALDRWVNSRPVWNQHAYFVTNVNDDGTIPSTGEARSNWLVEGLNNYRQNIEGDLRALAAPDITSRDGEAILYCDPLDGALTLEVVVCNRGTEPVADGMIVEFFDGPVDDDERICRGSTSARLAAGDCTTVSCIWPDPPRGAATRDVYVVPDPDDRDLECEEGNNTAVIRDVSCPG